MVTRKVPYLLVLLFMIPIIMTAGSNSKIEYMTIEDDYVLSDRTFHDPIFITDDSDFISQAWPGNGTIEDPYRIEGLSITSNGTACIDIRNVSKHYKIINCELSGARGDSQGAVSLPSTPYNGTGIITGCDIYNSTNGIYCTSDNVVIMNNDVRNCSFSNIRIEGKNQTITNNELVHEEMFSIHGNILEDIVVSDNQFSNSSSLPGLEWQFWLQAVNGLILENNTFSMTRCKLVGNDMYITNNRFSTDYRTSLYLPASHDIVVIDCEFEGASDPYSAIYGIRLDLSTDNCSIISCTSDVVIAARDVSNITVQDCHFTRDGVITFKDTTGYLGITNNTFHDVVGGVSIVVGTGIESAIVDNNVIQECVVGISLRSNGTVVRNNTIMNNIQGVIVRESENRIFYNTFINNEENARESLEVSNIWDDSVSMGNYWDRYFTVNDRWPVYLDDDAPVIDTVLPVSVAAGQNVTLNFTATDNTPFSYSIYIDGELLESGDWDGSPVVIEITSLTAGAHEIEIVFTDINGNSATHTVAVTVQEDVPVTMVVAGIGVAVVLIVAVFVTKKR